MAPEKADFRPWLRIFGAIISNIEIGYGLDVAQNAGTGYISDITQPSSSVSVL